MVPCGRPVPANSLETSNTKYIISCACAFPKEPWLRHPKTPNFRAHDCEEGQKNLGGPFLSYYQVIFESFAVL